MTDNFTSIYLLHQINKHTQTLKVRACVVLSILIDKEVVPKSIVERYYIDVTEGSPGFIKLHYTTDSYRRDSIEIPFDLFDFPFSDTMDDFCVKYKARQEIDELNKMIKNKNDEIFNCKRTIQLNNEAVARYEQHLETLEGNLEIQKRQLDT